MSDSAKRWIEYYQATGKDFMMLRGTLWTVYQRMVVPEGPDCRDFTISPSEQQMLLSHFKNAVLVRYTDGFQPPAENAPWYSVTCPKFLDLGDYTSHFRNMIRKGLKNCVVGMADAEYIAAHGYEVYMAAFAKYKGTRLPNISRNEWQRRILITKDYPDIIHYWSVFVDKKLAAYSTNMIFDTTEAAYTAIKFHPDFLKAYPSYALFFKMNEYYLQERSFDYVNDGSRSIKHDTNVQEFLVQKFGFRRTPTHLYVCYRPWVSAALSIPGFAKRWLRKTVRAYGILCTMDDARTRTAS